MNVNPIVQIFLSKTVLFFNITNTKNNAIYGFKIQLFDLYDESAQTELNITIKPFDKEKISILKHGTLQQVELVPKMNLEKLLEEQKNSANHINSRPGAMALAQDKIQLFNEYNEKYIQSITKKLQS